ncbi:hypothetical protein Droror1_Dr00022811 [Drosera rotundifolia]
MLIRACGCKIVATHWRHEPRYLRNHLHRLISHSKREERFKSDYNLFNAGLMKIPMDLPGFAFRNSRLATVGRLVDMMAATASQSKTRILSGRKPDCLIDFWMQEIIREEAAAKERGEKPLSHSSNHDIGVHLLNFLFAAQDSITSSLIWAVTLLEVHPTFS